MSGKIKIDFERCKGCGLCVIACPRDCIAMSDASNKNGYFPAMQCNGDCSGCGNCAVMCPEAAIEVSRSSNIVAVDSASQRKRQLAKEEL